MRTIDISELKKLVQKVQEALTTSNDIVPRETYPYYYNHPSVPISVPKQLKLFKTIITSYRTVLAKSIAALKIQQLGALPANFAEGGMFHQLTLGLAIASLGFGECIECVFKLAAELILVDCGDILVLNLAMTNSKPGMERGHAVLVANVKKDPQFKRKDLTFQDILKELPPETIVADPFVGVCFKANEPMPQKMKNYVAAYGGEMTLVQGFHMHSFSRNVLAQHFLPRAANAVREMKAAKQVVYEQVYHTSLRHKIEKDNSPIVISELNQLSNLSFEAYRTDSYIVDVVAVVKNKAERIVAINLMARLNFILANAVNFMQNELGQRILVIQDINHPDRVSPLQIALKHEQSVQGEP